MTLGVIADDFTGAGDVANTLTRAGLETVILFGVTAPIDAANAADASVIALKTRSIAVAEAVEQSLTALARLQALGATQILFKICSTFDSTPQGNIGPVSEALAAVLGYDGPVVVCPAFPAAGRTVFQGHLFVGDRLLSESGMQHHPLNPMTDPDLRRWLALQSKHPVGYLPLNAIRAGADAITAKLAQEAARGCRLVIADAIVDEDLLMLGAALSATMLSTGGSGLGLGLAATHHRASRIPARAQTIAGPGAILSGSCSTATRGQIERHARTHPTWSVEIDDLMSGRVDVSAIVGFVLSKPGAQPLVYSSTDPAKVDAAQQRHGRDAIAARLDRFFGDLAADLVQRGVTRLVVAGGETSGAVVSALQLGGVRVGAELATGVPLLHALDRPLAIVLKSGNFGGPELFSDALTLMRGDAHADR